MKFDFQTFLLFQRISAVSVLLPVFISIVKFKRLENELKTLGVLLYIAAVFEIILEILANYGITNLPLFHLFTIIEFSFLGLVFYRVFIHPQFKKAIVVTIICFVAFAVSNALFIQTIYEFNTITRGVECFLLILLALLFLYKIFNGEPIMHIEKYPMFWVNTGILIYFSGSFFLFIISNYCLELYREMLHVYWGIHSALNIAVNVLFAVGFWYSRKK